MVTKVQLHDCCGAQHIYGFPSSKIGTAPIVCSLVQDQPYMTKSVYLPITKWLKISLATVDKFGYTFFEHEGTKYRTVNRNPGITTALLASYQNRTWGPVLTKLGFTVTVNNIRNLNSRNQIYLYTRIENPIQREDSPRWHVDGVPVRGVRLKPDATPYRLRVNGELRTPEPIIDPSPSVPLVI